MLHIFPKVCLMKYQNYHGVSFPAVFCRLCNPKIQKDVCHRIHHLYLVTSIFSDSTQSRFQHMVPIQEELLFSRLYSHFILGIGCKVIHNCDVQLDLVSLSEVPLNTRLCQRCWPTSGSSHSCSTPGHYAA